MFNEGLGGLGKIMDACGCPVSASNKAILRKMDEQNIKDAERQALLAVKKIRKKRRAKRKGFQDKTLESEGVKVLISRCFEILNCLSENFFFLNKV